MLQPAGQQKWHCQGPTGRSSLAYGDMWQSRFKKEVRSRLLTSTAVGQLHCVCQIRCGLRARLVLSLAVAVVANELGVYVDAGDVIHDASDLERCVLQEVSEQRGLPCADKWAGETQTCSPADPSIEAGGMNGVSTPAGWSGQGVMGRACAPVPKKPLSIVTGTGSAILDRFRYRHSSAKCNWGPAILCLEDRGLRAVMRKGRA